jgi:hypothetical protein
MLRAMHGRGRLPHALLFVGPRGVGKGLVARELVKLLFCASPVGKDPEAREACGRCSACQRVDRGTHPDLAWFRKEPDRNDFRISLVSRREGSPDVTVLDSLVLHPMEAPRTVTVIDDAECLNPEAANALLKSLEEPAPHAVLILLCADASSLPSTILSRCQWVTFRPLPEEFIAGKLAEVLANGKGAAARPEGPPPARVSAEEAAFVCRFAGGSIEQAVALAGSGLWDLKRRLLDRLPDLDEAVALDLAGDIATWAAARAREDRVTKEPREETALRRTAAQTALAAVVTAVRDAVVVACLAAGSLPAGQAGQAAGAEGPLPLVNLDQPGAIGRLAAWPEGRLGRAIDLLAAAQAQIGRYVHPELATENALVQLSRLVPRAAAQSSGRR